MSANAVASSPHAKSTPCLDALQRALGPALHAALADASIVEILINADGRVRLDGVGRGIVATDVWLTAGERETAIRLLAAQANVFVTPDMPYLSATLPGSGARVQALLPPLAPGPTLAIRKRPAAIFTLDDYVRDGAARQDVAQDLRRAVAARENIIVAGSTGSGKTTLLNALLAEESFARARVIILEDTAELRCDGPDVVQLLTKRRAPPVGMRDLIQMTLRLRPDRIVVGEVRDGAALEVLKAWNTGHPGGLLSLHANSAADALHRLEDLCMEAGLARPARLIASAIDAVVFIARTPGGRRIEEIVRVGAPRAHRPHHAEEKSR